MEYMGWVLGLVSFIWCVSLQRKVARLERIVKANDLNEVEVQNLRKVLEKYIGKKAKLTFYNEALFLGEELGGEYEILDVDEKWVRAKSNPGKKNEAEKLLSIDGIKGVTLVK